MHGSRILHDSRLELTISTATVTRDLSNDWHRAEKEILVLEFTEAQWAQFVSSSGMGGGVPCTFRYLPKDYSACERVPDIAGDPDARPDFREEIESAMRKQIGRLDSVLAKAEALLSGKGAAGKRELESMIGELRIAKEHIVSNVGYVAKQFTDHMETTVTEATIAVEAFASNYAKDLGLQVLRGERLLENDPRKGAE